MTTINISTEIRKEIETSISQFEQLIQKEMSFSVDLRKHYKIISYTNRIIELQNSLKNGIL